MAEVVGCRRLGVAERLEPAPYGLLLRGTVGLAPRLVGATPLELAIAWWGSGPAPAPCIGVSDRLSSPRFRLGQSAGLRSPSHWVRRGQPQR